MGKTSIHLDFNVLPGCKNMEESFGEICVKCNKCGRFGDEAHAPNPGTSTEGDLYRELGELKAENSMLRVANGRLKRREETILRWLDDSCCPPRMLGSRCPERACGECFREALDREEVQGREEDGGRESA
jgi:hypothetical protein